MMKFPTFLRSFETFHHCKILCHWDPCHKFQTILAVGGMCQHKQQNEMSKPSMVPWTWIWDSLSLPFDSGLLGHQQSYVWQFEGPRMDVSLILLVTSQGMKPLNFEFCAGVWTVTQLAVCVNGKKLRCQYRRSGIGDRHTRLLKCPRAGEVSSLQSSRFWTCKQRQYSNKYQHKSSIQWKNPCICMHKKPVINLNWSPLQSCHARAPKAWHELQQAPP